MSFRVEQITFPRFAAKAAEYGPTQDRPGSLYFGALDEGGSVVGTVEVRRSGRTSVIVEVLYVDPAFRRRGLGLQMLEAVMNYAAAAGWIRKVRASALYTSLALFLRLGFVKTKERKNGWWVEKKL